MRSESGSKAEGSNPAMKLNWISTEENTLGILQSLLLILQTERREKS